MSKTSNRFSPEVRDRAVRMVGEHRADYASEWAAQTSDDKARLKLLERDVKKLRRANDILRKASAYFAQAELDRHDKW